MKPSVPIWCIDRTCMQYVKDMSQEETFAVSPNEDGDNIAYPTRSTHWGIVFKCAGATEIQTSGLLYYLSRNRQKQKFWIVQKHMVDSGNFYTFFSQGFLILGFMFLLLFSNLSFVCLQAMKHERCIERQGWMEFADGSCIGFWSRAIPMKPFYDLM